MYDVTPCIVSTSIHIKLPLPLYGRPHTGNKVHIYPPNLKAGTMTLHAGITSPRQDNANWERGPLMTSMSKIYKFSLAIYGWNYLKKVALFCYIFTAFIVYVCPLPQLAWVSMLCKKVAYWAMSSRIPRKFPFLGDPTNSLSPLTAKPRSAINLIALTARFNNGLQYCSRGWLLCQLRIISPNCF